MIDDESDRLCLPREKRRRWSLIFLLPFKVQQLHLEERHAHSLMKLDDMSCASVLESTATFSYPEDGSFVASLASLKQFAY